MPHTTFKQRLPRPGHGAFTRAARRCGINAKKLSRIWNDRFATADEARAILADPDLAIPGVTFATLTGVQLEAGTPLGSGLVAQRPTADRSTIGARCAQTRSLPLAGGAP